MGLAVDRRQGSLQLAAPLRALLPGTPVNIRTLAFGDIAFNGNGPEDRPVRIGIEVKKVGDLISSFTTGRLAGHQVPGMVRSYERCWLLIEGGYRPGLRTGVLEVPTGKGKWGNAHTALTYRELDTFLVGLEVRAGFRIRRTWDETETVNALADLYRWWQKPWKDHDSLETYDESRPFTGMREPTLCERMASQIPGIGWERAQEVARRFRTAEAMTSAGAAEWRKIPGIGEVLAARAFKLLRGMR